MKTTHPEAQRQEPEVVRRKERLGERPVLWVREVLHGARDELAREHERQDVDVPQELVARDNRHLIEQRAESVRRLS